MNTIFDSCGFVTKTADKTGTEQAVGSRQCKRGVVPAYGRRFAACTARVKVLAAVLLFFSVVPMSAACEKPFAVQRFSAGLPEKRTESPAAPLSSLMQEIIAELNAVRRDPAKYADEVIAPRLAYFERRMYKVPGSIPLATREGAAAVKDCIKALKAASPAGALEADAGLSRAAQWLADDQARTGRVGHIGSDGSNPVKRIERFGSWSGSVGENCAYGLKDAREIVAQLLIDDGVGNRGHRKTILNPAFKKVGIGYSEAGKAAYGAVAVMDFAAAFTAK